MILLGLVALVSAQGDNCRSSRDVEGLLRDWESVWGAQISDRRTDMCSSVSNTRNIQIIIHPNNCDYEL